MLPPIRGSQNPSRPGAAKRSAGPGFALPEADGARAAPGAVAVPGASGLLGLQQSWSPAERDAAAQRRGSAMLLELEALHLDLLSGGIESGHLARLAALAEGEAGADPALREIIEGISLRARIELARLPSSGPGQSREIASGPCTWDD